MKMNIFNKKQKNINLTPEANEEKCNHNYIPIGSTTFVPMKECSKCGDMQERCF